MNNQGKMRITLDEVIRLLQEQNEYQAKMIALQAETIDIQNKQNQELQEMLRNLLATIRGEV